MITIAVAIVGAIAFLYPIHITAPVRLDIRRWSRPLIAAIVVAAARHLLAPSPTLPTRIRIWLGCHPGLLRSFKPLLVALVTRGLVLLVGYIAALTIPFPSDIPASPSAWWDLPYRWDANWYLSIVRKGYEWNGRLDVAQNLNFFPAYPAVVRLAAAVIRIPHVPPEAALGWIATLASIAAFMGASVYLARFVAEEFDDAAGMRAVVLLASYPFAVFYSAVYSESLFLLCAVAAWYHLRHRQIVLAAIWGALTGLCRPNGSVLVVVLVLDVWSRSRGRRARPGIAPTLPEYVAAAAPLVGTVLYSAFAYHLTGHPFVWAELQRTAWGRMYQTLGESVWAELRVLSDIGLVRYLTAWPWRFFNLAPTIFALATIWPVTRRLGLAAGVFVAANTLLPLLNGGLVSMGRYTATLFPIFVWLAVAVEGVPLAILAAAFGIMQGAVAIMFFSWRPVF